MQAQGIINGAKVITANNYVATHGCENFQAYAEALRLEFLERRASGVYIIAGLIRDVVNLADFAGFNVARLKPETKKTLPVWVVQRAPDIVVVERDC